MDERDMEQGEKMKGVADRNNNMLQKMGTE
jgi:hypothetical protein